MKAITIWQPWAALIMSGVKTVENRKWTPNIEFGTRIAIHAGKDDDVAEWVVKEIEALGAERVKALCWEKGRVLGTVEWCGFCTNPSGLPEGQRKWFAGPYGWILRNPRPLVTPVLMKGKLGLWDLPIQVA